MDIRLLFCFCLLTLVRSDGEKKPVITVSDNGVLKCEDGTFEGSVSEVDPAPSGTYTCKAECPEETCPEQMITVSVRTSENLLELDMPALVSVLVGDLLATALIGWAVYSICAQHTPRSSYQGNKASDKVNLINNSTGDTTYQPLNTRSDEYSTLHTQRKHRNAKHALSP